MVSAYRNSKKDLKSALFTTISMSAAFAFLVMLFDMRLPGGATGHAIGAAAITVLFGPWAGIFATSIAIAIQAFVFHTGGITTLGANCISMAVISVIYRILLL